MAPLLPVHPQVVLTEPQNGRTVPITAGAELEIRLLSNPSIGYEWQLVQGPPAIVDVRRAYIPRPASGASRVGALGEQVFDLRVLAASGRVVPVALAYKPPGRRMVFGRVWKVRLRVTP